MKMPEKIKPIMFAPCGMNCLVCYNTRYHASIMGNSKMVKEQGMAEFLVQQKENYTCPECGGIISIHDAECSECQWKM